MAKESLGKEYLVLLGSFGSGKTELALHFAHSSAEAGNDTTLIDLDIINPYFRAAERKLTLEKAGVRLIYPNFAMSNVELITVNPEVYSAFVGGSGTVIFDVGGDNVGSRALGQYYGYFAKIPPERLKIWLVINPHRPMSATPKRVMAMMHSIEDSSRLKITGLINNGNMSYESQGEDLANSYQVIKAVSEQSGIPVVLTSGEEIHLTQFLDIAKVRKLEQKYIGEPLIIQTKMHRDWPRFVKFGL